MKKIIFLLLPLLVPLKAAALELLLEENRGESGTIGYVDIDRVFKEYSGTTGAREDFMAAIKTKEDAVNAKRAAIFTLKAEIAKLRQEREFALMLPSLLETKRRVDEAARAAAQAAEVSTATAVISTVTAATPAETPAVSTGTAAAISTGTAEAVTAPAAAASPVPVPALAAAETSTPAPAAPPPGMPGMPAIEDTELPAVYSAPGNSFKFSISTSVPEIDSALAGRESELKTKESDLRDFQRAAERELLDYESHKSEILLGRIYVALKELAAKEEVSVVVDKRNILYGQNAVDLTGKLLTKLEEGGI